MKTGIMLFIASIVFGALSSFAAGNEYLVKYNSSRGYNLLANGQLRNSSVRVLSHLQTAQLFKVSIDLDAKITSLAQLLSEPVIEYVVPNAKVHAFNAPVDANALKDQWAISKVQAEKAWTRAGNKGSRNVIVAVIDTGADYKHESLAPNMVPGYDFNGNDNDPMDETGSQNPGHGTHCSGIIGGTGLMNGGITGISPEVSIMPLRFLGKDGSGDLEGAIKAIDYAIEKNVQVISASWGATIAATEAQPLVEAVKRADDKGIIFVAAAANDGKNNDTTSVYPANNGLPNSITVAASAASDAKPSWSNYGKGSVHLAAPGDGIMSTLPGNKYGNLSGTSMATPLVSGLVAFLKAQDMTLTGAQVRALLQTTGSKVSIETACNCRVDAFSAVDALLSKKMYVVPAAATLKMNDTMQLQVMNGKAPYSFTSSAGAVTVDANGMVKAAANGAATITVKDANGMTASSLDYNVGAASQPTNPPTDPTNPTDPGMGECPFGDKATCDLICQIQPSLPFCK
jgi:thermitase